MADRCTITVWLSGGALKLHFADAQEARRAWESLLSAGRKGHGSIVRLTHRDGEAEVGAGHIQALTLGTT